MRRMLLAMLAAGSLLAVAASKPTSSIPAELANYQSWTLLTTEAQLIPSALAAACMPMAAAPQTSAKTPPDLWVAVFANPVASKALQAKAGVFPPGAVIAKEKLRKPKDPHPEGVAFMIKHAEGELVASGGWEFRYYPAEKDASYERCVTCHRAAKRDYVFTQPGTPANE